MTTPEDPNQPPAEEPTRWLPPDPSTPADPAAPAASEPPAQEPPPADQPPSPEPPPYAAPPPAYGTPAYGTPPPPGYGAPAYGTPPPPGYGGPPPGYGAPPPPGYGAPGYGQMPLRNDYAAWITRVAGTLIDGFAIAIPVFIVVLLGSAIGGGFGVFLIIVAYVGALAFFVWNYVFRQGNTGQSIGKSVMGTKLLRENTNDVVGPGMAFLRYLCHIVDSLPCYLGYLWPLWDSKRQTFSDKICGTIVIKL